MHRRRHVLPVVRQRPGDLLRGGDRDQRLIRNEFEWSEEAVHWQNLLQLRPLRLVPVLARAHETGLVPVLGGQLRGRRELDPLRLAEGTLGEGREPAQRLDLVAEQLDADRALLGRGVDVEDPAADRELPALLDLLDALVAGVRQQLGDVAQVHLLVLVEHQAVRPQLGVGDRFCQRDCTGHHHRGGVTGGRPVGQARSVFTARRAAPRRPLPSAGGQSGQGRHAQARQVRRWSDMREVARSARGIEMDAAGGQERVQIGSEVSCRAVVSGDQEGGPGCRRAGLDQRGQHVGPQRRRDVRLGRSIAERSRQGLEAGVLLGDLQKRSQRHLNSVRA